MVAYLLRAPAGIAGDINRGFACTIEPIAITPLGTTGHPNQFGIPMVIDATTHQARMVAAGDAAADVYGLLVRPYVAFSSQDPLGTSTPPTEGPVDVLRMGYMSVRLRGDNAAVKGAVVAVWTAASATTHVTGTFEAGAPGGNGFALTGLARFMGPADPDGNTEISCDFMG